MVGDELLNVTVWFGANPPTADVYEEANAQLAGSNFRRRLGGLMGACVTPRGFPRASIGRAESVT
jgi:hypothetical protein